MVAKPKPSCLLCGRKFLQNTWARRYCSNRCRIDMQNIIHKDRLHNDPDFAQRVRERMHRYEQWRKNRRSNDPDFAQRERERKNESIRRRLRDDPDFVRRRRESALRYSRKKQAIFRAVNELGLIKP